jgi:hypothetical protein
VRVPYKNLSPSLETGFFHQRLLDLDIEEIGINRVGNAAFLG